MRNSLLPGIVLLMAVTLSWSVTAQTPNAAPSPATPQMSPQSAPPAQSTSPQDQDASPAARPAPGQNSSTASAPTHTDEENPLGLTDAQKAQLRPIVTEETQQMEAVRNDSSLSQEQKMSKINQIREAASPKIKAILTPEQLQRLAQMQRARQQQDQSNAPQAQPQH